MRYELYADGACQPNPGIGGWAFIVQQEEEPGIRAKTKFYSGAEKDTTNNKMELISILRGLELLDKEIIHGQISPSEISITSDSQYAILGLSQWSKKWIEQGWIKKGGKSVLNKDLWISLLEVIDSIKSKRIIITYNHVPGHSGHPQNEQCDKMAVKAINDLRNKNV